MLRKLKIAILAVLLCLYATQLSAERISTKKMTASGQVTTSNALYCGHLVYTDGSNNVTVGIYVGTDTNGEILVPPYTAVAADKGINGENLCSCVLSPGGINVTLSGTNGYVIVRYSTY